MPTVTFVHPDGKREGLDIASGESVMRAAVAAGLDGIVAECGGAAMCATCHVYVDESQIGLLPDMDAVEDEMLGSTVSERKATSRLSCQLVVTDEMDGLVVFLPEAQI